MFASLDDAIAEHLAAAWARALEAAGARDADVLHLHHLTPLNEAAARVAPDVPVVGHLHGTELLMLEAIEAEPERWAHARGVGGADARLGGALRAPAGALHEPGRARRAAARRAARAVRRGPQRLRPRRFQPREVDRGAHWAAVRARRWRATRARCCSTSGASPRVKRVPLLIEAYAQAQRAFAERAPLVLVGGFPDECEGEHPDEAIARTGARDVHLAGWHEHDVLPRFLNAADVVVLPSVAEQFGQVLVEGMACARPVIAVDSHGPAEIVDAGETGWLVEPDDRDGARRRARGGRQPARGAPPAGPRTPARSRSSATPGPRWPSAWPRSTQAALGRA